jgi:hypothetical protein
MTGDMLMAGLDGMDEEVMSQAADAMRRIAHNDPDGWASYLSELDVWDSAACDELDDAADEWPEYNTPEYRATIGTRLGANLPPEPG